MLEQYQPLFLKYRPQAISELVGQSSVASTLTNAIKYERISHAYLFTGPRGTGKTSTARIFAKSINCEIGPTSEPCQKCTSCLEIRQGISPSVFEIDAASNNSVDDARLLIERAPLSAAGGRYKLYIIDECHMLTKEAFNALLKTIEEPPANVIFILATTEEHKVLPTIVSRCQKLIFRLIDEKAMTAQLSEIAAKEHINIESSALTALARRANGGMRDALSLLDQISLLGMGEQAISTEDILLLTGALPDDILVSLSDHIFKREGQKVLSLLQELFLSGREAHLIASELAKHMLNIAKAAFVADAAQESNDYVSGSEKYKNAIALQAKLIDQSELIQMVEEVDKLEVSCRRAAQPIMNLEIGLLSLCQRLDILELRSIQSRLQKLENALSSGKTENVSEENKSAKVKAVESKPVDSKLEEARINTPQPIRPKVEDPIPAKNKVAEEILASKSKEFGHSPTNLEANVADSTSTLSAKIEEIDDQLGEEESSPEMPKDEGNIDIIWQNILSELQRRHLPTFSLVSTHAFPIDISGNTLNIGVFVENFQKMIESKVEYIKMAAVACKLSKDLHVRVKVAANGKRTASASVNNERADLSRNLSAQSSLEGPSSGNSQSPPVAATLSTRSSKDDKKDPSAVKEAYKLFEGPGSRYIAPS